MVRIVKRSGRSLGSSSSSHSIGAETGAPGSGPRAVGRDQGLVDGVLGVVQPGQPGALADLPLPADQLGHDGARRSATPARPTSRVSSNDGPVSIGTQIWMPRRPVSFGHAVDAEVLEGRPVQPGEDQQVRPRGPLAGVEVDQRVGRPVRVRPPARSRRATPGRRSSPPTPAPPARRRRGTSASRPGRRPGCPSGAATTGAWLGSSLCQKPLVPTPFGNRCMFSARRVR